MMHPLTRALGAFLLAMTTIATVAAAPETRDGAPSIHFQEDGRGDNFPVTDVVSADDIIRDMIESDVMPEEWSAEIAIPGNGAAADMAPGIAVPEVSAPVVVTDTAPVIVAGEPSPEQSSVATDIPAETATGEVVADDTGVVESDEQPLPEDEFAGFTMPGLVPSNLTVSVLADIDAFWAGEFATRGRDYYPAATVAVTESTYSSCGIFGPYDNPAAYCPMDDTVYYSVPLGQDIQTNVGDFAWITVLAHEWGHHVQVVLGITPELTTERELQADCLSGAYAHRAQRQGYLQEGDVSEAAVIAILSGDPAGLDAMSAGAHGSGDARLTAFMQGYFDGAGACLG